jgi:hypothetical protein
MERDDFDQAFAALNILFYKLAMFDVCGILSMSRFAKAAYLDLPEFNPKMYLSGSMSYCATLKVRKNYLYC